MSHSRLPASASSRWLRCPGSVRLIEQLKKSKKIPKDSTNDAAELGTLVHHIIEEVLLGNKKIRDFRGKTLRLEDMTRSFKITSKELHSARKCVNYVKKKMSKLNKKKVQMFPERKYDLSEIYGIDLGGTSDVTIAEKKGMLEIVDYKNGKWAVEIDGNTQLRLYALGAWYALDEVYEFQSIRITIVQPNCEHEDGIIRSDVFTVEELIQWERRVLVPVLEDMKAKREKLVPDEENQCYWCEAKAHCEARQKNKPVLTSKLVKDIIPVAKDGTLPEPHELSIEELQNILQDVEPLIKFYSDCRKYALQLLEDDIDSVPNYGLVPKLGNRVFIDDKELKRKLRRRRINVKDITVKEDRLMRPTELELYLKEMRNWEASEVTNFMEEVTHRPSNGHVLKKLDTAEDDFAEFAKPRKGGKDRKLRKRRKL